ncbi:MAG: hypothetical protein EBQ95_02960 [Gammaproteobacteria bacterium]|nr:hypothetical protein [Gammaproteobacteria bacterium]
MLFEAQLLFSLPATIGASSAILAPFFNLLLLAALLALLYFIFQTNLGRNILGLIGGATLINLFFMPSSREQRYDSHRYHSVFDSPPPTPSFRNTHVHQHPAYYPNQDNRQHGHSSQGYDSSNHSKPSQRVHGHY